MVDLFFHERKARACGYRFICGVDEAGRGALAGPVVAAACLVPEGVHFAGIDDSKRLTQAERERLFGQITSCEGVVYGVGCVGPEQIDALNILQATLLAMQEAVAALAVRPDYVLIDGNRCPTLKMAHEAVVRGDSKVHAIMAAAILAKVTRDRLMAGEMEALYPQYGFGQHKGYGTKAHVEALARHGVSAVHRRSFGPCQGERGSVAEHRGLVFNIDISYSDKKGVV